MESINADNVFVDERSIVLVADLDGAPGRKKNHVGRGLNLETLLVGLASCVKKKNQ